MDERNRIEELERALRGLLSPRLVLHREQWPEIIQARTVLEKGKKPGGPTPEEQAWEMRDQAIYERGFADAIRLAAEVVQSGIDAWWAGRIGGNATELGELKTKIEALTAQKEEQR